MPKIAEITACLERLAPPAYQESYDNSGLIVGDFNAEVTNVLVSLDCTEAVIDEAIAQNCNLVVAHHPIVFKGLKKLNGKNYVERTVLKAIKNDVAIYAIHTNLDHVRGGVNDKIAQKLGLKNVRILAPKTGTLQKIVIFVPLANTQPLLDALHAAGAGQVGNYSQCSFAAAGTGRFRPNEAANPVVGQRGSLESTSENRVEVIFPSHLQPNILAAMRAAHPYEEVAFYVSDLLNADQNVGAGAIGELPEALTTSAFLSFLKHNMNLRVIRHTSRTEGLIQRVAVCGGAGSFLLHDALRQKADAFVTADYKYHEFFDAEDRLIICDIGHYESEVYTKELLQGYLSENFPNFATILCQTNTNPVNYYF